MSWSPFTQDVETTENNEAVINERVEQVATRMADLAKQMELLGSDNFAWYQRYLEALRDRVINEAIAIEDPIKHAEKRAEYRLLAFLIALPQKSSLEYQALKDEIETLRPDTGTLDG